MPFWAVLVQWDAHRVLESSWMMKWMTFPFPERTMSTAFPLRPQTTSYPGRLPCLRCVHQLLLIVRGMSGWLWAGQEVPKSQHPSAMWVFFSEEISRLKILIGSFAGFAADYATFAVWWGPIRCHACQEASSPIGSDASGLWKWAQWGDYPGINWSQSQYVWGESGIGICSSDSNKCRCQATQSWRCLWSKAQWVSECWGSVIKKKNRGYFVKCLAQFCPPVKKNFFLRLDLNNYCD